MCFGDDLVWPYIGCVKGKEWAELIDSGFSTKSDDLDVYTYVNDAWSNAIWSNVLIAAETWKDGNGWVRGK